MRKPNDVGVAWKKTNDKGEYISIALDVDVLLELAGGSIEKASISMYPIVSENPKAPDFQLKFYPKPVATAGAPRRPAPPAIEKPLLDDDIPW